MSLREGLKDRTFYAIINFGSESVMNNRDAITKAISIFSNKYGVRVDCHLELDYCIYCNWDEIDRQFNIAKYYSDILVFGGDGTQTYVLNKVINENINVNFIGVAVGTMNISTYSNSLTELEFIFDSPKTIWLDAICCIINGRKHFCFIDSVVTTTCVARINGKISQASAKEVLAGHKYRAIPESVGDKNTLIVVENGAKITNMPSTDKIFTISCAFLRDSLKAQVLAGGADPSACSEFKWGLIISDFPLTWADVTQHELQLYSPIKSLFYPLSVTDSVKISRLLEAAYLVIDGNVISNVDSLNVTYAKNICKIIKCGGS